MSAPALIPAGFVARAHRHLRRTGQPLLMRPRQRGDLALLVSKNPASGRWLVYLNPRSVPVLYDELADICREPDAKESEQLTRMMLRLHRYAANAVEELPGRFECDGQTVGRVDVADHCSVFASSALAVSCLSWLLRAQRTGLYLQSEPDG